MFGFSFSETPIIHLLKLPCPFLIYTTFFLIFKNQFISVCIYLLWSYPQHMEVPRPGTESELQLHDLHHSCGNTGSFHTLHWARDQTGASEATRVTAFGFLTHCAIAGTPKIYLFNFQIFLVLFITREQESEIFFFLLFF